MLRGKIKKTLAGALSLSMAFGTALSSVSVLPIQAADETLPEPALIPRPLESEFGDGSYTLDPCTRIVVQAKNSEDEQSLLNTADLLAARFRKSTGYSLPVVKKGAAEGDIILRTSDAKEELEEEGYTLTADETGIVIEAYEPAGVFNGTQTLRQMFPADIEKQEVVDDASWVVKEASIKDKPEYGYRGMHLDVARHFFTVEQVKRQIDLISQFKINKLHMHLSDDQGWRLEIKGEMYGESLDKLRTIGASTSCKTNGYNPGQYSQEDFKELVRYAAERNVEIIPEFDMPAHAWAALVSLNFLNSTEDGKPHAGNYDNTKPYDGWDVGWASLEVNNEKTYEFIEEVVKQVSEISPSPIINLGGDEAHSTTAADYNKFCNRVVEIGNKYGKTVMGWQNMDKALTDENKENAIVQFWSTGNAKMMSGVKYICTPADHAYMDMKYDTGSEFGLTWATYNPTDDSYNWEPTNYGTRDQIVGVECCLWTETIATDYALDYMIYPRVAGHAEVGWTAPNSRTWNEYKGRIAQFYDRFINEGIQLRKDEIIWPTPYEPVNATFSFEEGEGNTITDENGKYIGTFKGNVKFVDGVKGKGIYLDGSSSVQIDYNKDLQGPWTASMWVKRENSVGSNAVLLAGKEGELKLDQWKNTGKVGVTKFDVKDYSYNYSAPLNEWVYLTFVCDESSTVLYVNGERIGSSSTVIKGPFSIIGHTGGSSTSTGYMKGTMDEFSMFNSALTPEEVQDLYAQYSSVSKADLEAVINQAKALNEADWTAATWAVLAAALEAAQNVYDDENATEDEIRGAINSLKAAMDGLEKFLAENEIRIASYNIAANKKPNLEAMSDQMKDNGITIAGVQEVDVNTGRNNYDMLERLSSYGYFPYHAFQKAIDFSGGQYGIGVLSTVEITDQTGGPLISEGIDEARAWMRTVINKDGHELVLYNTHLTHENLESRTAQMKELLAIVAADPAEYIAVTGDFNTETGAKEWREAMKFLNLTNGYNGKWLCTYNGFDDDQMHAIDNILVTRNLKLVNAYMVENKLSDHNMLVGQFEFLDAAETSFEYLNALLEDARAIDGENYTEASFGALQDAIAAAEALGEDAAQEEVDAAAAALEAAMAALEEKGGEPVEPAEKTIINDSEVGTGLNQYNFVGQWKTSTGYPNLFHDGDEHWVNFSSFTGDVMPYYTITFDGTGVEIFGNKESNAGIYEVSIDDGEPVDVDAYAPERQTQSLLFSVRDLPFGRHTIKVQSTDRKNEASSAHNIEADYAIVYNEKSPEPSEDTSRIKALLHEAMLYAETIMNSENYGKVSPVVRQYMEESYAAATAVYEDEAATYDEVVDAWKALINAIHMADFYADKTDLKNRIDESNAMDLSGYTEESAAALREAIAAAQAVYDDDTALQERIDEALNNLNNAIAGLVEQPSDVDKSLLKVLLDESAAVIADGENYIHDAAWDAFLAAYDSAKAVYDDARADEEAVAAAINELGSAFLAVRHLPDEELLKALEEFVTLSDTLTRELYDADTLQEIDTLRAQCFTLMAADPFDSAAAQDLVDNKLAPMTAYINDVESQNKPAEPSKPDDQKPSIDPGTEEKPSVPAEDKPSVSDKEEPAKTQEPSTKPAETAKSVKTASHLNAAGWICAASGAGLAGLLADRRRRK